MISGLRTFVLARILDAEAAARRSDDPAPTLSLAMAHRRIVRIAADLDPAPRREILRTLAALHAEHRDYRREWRL